MESKTMSMVRDARRKLEKKHEHLSMKEFGERIFSDAEKEIKEPGLLKNKNENITSTENK